MDRASRVWPLALLWLPAGTAAQAALMVRLPAGLLAPLTMALGGLRS